MRLIKLPNGDYIAADAVVLISAQDQIVMCREIITAKVIVQLSGGSSSLIPCDDFAHAKQVAEDLAINISRVE